MDIAKEKICPAKEIVIDKIYEKKSMTIVALIQNKRNRYKKVFHFMALYFK